MSITSSRGNRGCGAPSPRHISAPAWATDTRRAPRAGRRDRPTAPIPAVHRRRAAGTGSKMLCVGMIVPGPGATCRLAPNRARCHCVAPHQGPHRPCPFRSDIVLPCTTVTITFQSSCCVTARHVTRSPEASLALPTSRAVSATTKEPGPERACLLARALPPLTKAHSPLGASRASREDRSKMAKPTRPSTALVLLLLLLVAVAPWLQTADAASGTPSHVLVTTID